MKKKSAFILVAILVSVGLCACGEAGKVTKSIEGLGEITLESGKAIEEAEATYGELTEKDKEKVENYETLVEAREEYDALVIEDTYSTAIELFEQQQYEEAKETFESIVDYKDSQDKIESCDLEIMYLTYEEVFSALDGNFWYFNGGSDTVLNRISFTKSEAKIAQVYYDGNGKHENDTYTYTYVVDDANIVLTLADESTMDISYKLSDGKLKLGDKEFFTEKQVDKALQGYWKSRSSKYGGSEKNIYIHDGELVSEKAATSLISEGYFYYGPYTGTYSLNFGGFDSDMSHANEWGFNIIDGEVVLLNYDNVCTRTDSLPGENGYDL